MKKKILAAVMSFAIVAAGVCGCGNGENAENDSSAVQEGSSSEEQRTEGGEAVGEGNEVETFKVLIIRDDAEEPDFLKADYMKELEEKAGVSIEWQMFNSGDWEEQKALLMAAKDLPDAFFGSRCGVQNDAVKNPELFVELTDLIKENMPNLTRIFEEDPEMLAQAKEADGKIYGLVRKRAFAPTYDSALYVNQKWLDNLNMEAPDTYEEFADMLRAFKEQDADGDGDPNNEIPMSSYNVYGIMNMFSACATVMSPFDTWMNTNMINYMTLDGDTPVFVPTTERYKEAVSWMHGLYAEKVLDQEWFTQDEPMYRAKLQAEGGSQVGCFYAYTADAGAGENAGDFVQVKALAGPDGKRSLLGSTTVSTGEFYITTKCANPAKLLQWVDGFYTDLVTLQTTYGPIPDCVKDNGDGTYEVLAPEDGTSLDSSAWANSFRDYAPQYMSREFADKVILPEDQGDGAKLASESMNRDYARQVYPKVKLTAEQNDALSMISTDITMYAESQFAHWIVDGGVEEEWDAYLEQMEAMQLPEYVRIYTEAYQAYVDSMKFD